jgi:hypothetical protein
MPTPISECGDIHQEKGINMDNNAVSGKLLIKLSSASNIECPTTSTLERRKTITKPNKAVLKIEHSSRSQSAEIHLQWDAKAESFQPIGEDELNFGFIHYDEDLPSSGEEELSLSLYVDGKTLIGHASIPLHSLVSLKTEQLVKNFILSLHVEKQVSNPVFRNESMVGRAH